MALGFGIQSPIESGNFMSPEAVAAKQKWAETLMAGSRQPVQHWAQGLNRLADALVGNLTMKNANKESAAARSAANQAVIDALFGGSGGSAGGMNGSSGGVFGSPAASGSPMAYAGGGGVMAAPAASGTGMDTSLLAKTLIGDQKPAGNMFDAAFGTETPNRREMFDTAFGEPAPPAFDAARAAMPAATMAPPASGGSAVAGLPPDFLTRVASIESGGNPNAVNRSGAMGAFQFMPETAKQYGLTNPMDPATAAEATARLAMDNRKVLAANLGREPTPAELYLAHQQGAGGASALLRNPNAPVVDALAAAYGGDQRKALQAVVQNGGNPSMTAGQFVQMWGQKYDGAGSPGQRPTQVAMNGPLPGGMMGGPPPGGMAGAAPPAEGGDMRARMAAILGNPWIDAGTKQAVMARMMPAAKGPVVVGADQRLVDPTTGRVIFGGESNFRPLTDPAERARFGIPETDKRPFQIGPDGKLVTPPGGTTVNIDQKTEGAFDKKAAEKQAERFDEIVKGGQDAAGMIASLNSLKEIGSRLTTGKTAEITNALGPYAALVGIDIANLGDTQAYQAIVSKLAPSMRVPGSGATSDFEMRQFLNALPGLGKTPAGNALIQSTLEGIAQHKQAAAAIASQAISGDITRQEAEKRLQALPDPLTLWKQAQKSGAQPAVAGPPKPGDVVDGFRYKGGDPANQNSWEQVQ